MTAPDVSGVPDVAELTARLDAAGYLADEGLATALHLALALGRPLLLEGEPGVGKTAAAKALAQALGAPFIRLQCYEGLTAGEALYDWNYRRQMLAIRLAESRGDKLEDDDLFTEEFLLERPVLRAVRHAGPTPPVLLIDEVDRADDEFEAFLLEILSDYTVSVPEVGTFSAEKPPVVVITSNRTRDVHDALKRRCLYHWVEHPSFDREVAIVRLRVPACSDQLARQVAAAVETMRDLNLYKPPGVAETIDWATALGRLGVTQLDERSVASTLGTVLKYREDHQRVETHGLADIVKQAFERSTRAG